MAPQSRGRRTKNKGWRAISKSNSTPDLLTAVTLPTSSAQGPGTTAIGDDPRDLDVSHLNSSEDLAEGEEEDDADFQSHYSLNNESSTSGSESSDSDATPLMHGKGRPPSLTRSHSSLLGPNPFAPPFYNRPPTPLPPSPSLTSLLRPTFSTTNSRPTTPDSSDVETPNDTEAAVAKSARTATTVPRASPKVPTYEYYGFVLYLVSSLAFVIYLLWSYLPSPFLHQLGIDYYPNRWWSLAIPSFLVMLIVYIYVALASYNTGYLTLPMTSIENMVDEAANVATIDAKGRVRASHREHRRPPGSRAPAAQGGGGPGVEVGMEVDWQSLWNEGTDAVMDVPIGGVCEILYGQDERTVGEVDDAAKWEGHLT